MESMNVVALISGGKDSLYSILHLLANSHNVVALGNLYPVASDGKSVDDLDSFMYQTIGHAIIPLYEQALGLPLYRQQTVGRAVSQSKVYQAPVTSDNEIAEEKPGETCNQATDEVEDLLVLLRRIVAVHPEVNAVSTGAILSDYQRTRVESAAVRLGLTPLSYLWQYPRIVTRSTTSLLEDMTAIGQDARIIKVSSSGLDDSFLWQNVADSRTIQRLRMASQRFGNADDGAALGEGGEYETLALCGPAPLWKGRIHIDEQDRQIIPGEAGSASLRLGNPVIVLGDTRPAAEVPIPSVLDAHFQAVFDELTCADFIKQPPHEAPPETHVARNIELSTERSVFLGAFTSGSETLPTASTQDQTRSILDLIGKRLRMHSIDLPDVVYTTVVLRDMADFVDVNAVFVKAFTTPNPPARAVVACADVLRPAERVMVSMTALKPHELALRQGLHVQSISYWAPANIGPYSQAITVPLFDMSGTTPGPMITFIAGQIPLDPASMAIAMLANASTTKQFLHHAVLSLQHAFRVAKVVGVKQWMHAIAFITGSDASTLATRSSIAMQVWQRAHAAAPSIDKDVSDDGDDTFDVWHQRHGARRQFPGFISSSAEDKVDFYSSLSIETPAVTIIQADSLPRGADIEWVVYGRDGETGPVHIEHYMHLTRLFESKKVGWQAV